MWTRIQKAISYLSENKWGGQNISNYKALAYSPPSLSFSLTWIYLSLPLSLPNILSLSFPIFLYLSLSTLLSPSLSLSLHPSLSLSHFYIFPPLSLPSFLSRSHLSLYFLLIFSFLHVAGNGLEHKNTTIRYLPLSLPSFPISFSLPLPTFPISFSPSSFLSYLSLPLPSIPLSLSPSSFLLSLFPFCNLQMLLQNAIS